MNKSTPPITTTAKIFYIFIHEKSERSYAHYETDLQKTESITRS